MDTSGLTRPCLLLPVLTELSVLLQTFPLNGRGLRTHNQCSVDVKVSVVPDIPSLRRIVRVKYSSMPSTISEKGAPFVSAVSLPPTESSRIFESQSESSVSMSVSSDSLSESGDVRDHIY